MPERQKGRGETAGETLPSQLEWTLGGFNVSNLMGIKRRMIDTVLAKKKLFSFWKLFENVQFFSHLHFKIAKSAIMTKKEIFLKNINMGIKKRRILKCKCEKIVHFQTFCKKEKVIFLPISIILRVIPIEIPKKV